MKKENLTREQAIVICGENVVKNVESQNCEPTGRYGYNGKCQNDDSIEWSAQVAMNDESSLIIYYYTDAEDETTDQWTDSIDWENCIAGYKIV